MRLRKSVLFIGVFLLLVACVHDKDKQSKVELRLSAASSLIDVMKELEAEFEAIHEDVDLIPNFGSSGKLARQMMQGAPVDVFLAASPDDMEQLVADGWIDSTSVIRFTENRLVIITGLPSKEKISMREVLMDPAVNHIAIGEPESVPLGRYSRRALEALGLYDVLLDRFVFGKDARQVFTYVQSGNAELGIVYRSDIKLTEQSMIIADLPLKDGEIITYPGGIASESTSRKEAELFMDFLVSKQAQELFDKYGFQQAE